MAKPTDVLGIPAITQGIHANASPAPDFYPDVRDSSIHAAFCDVHEQAGHFAKEFTNANGKHRRRYINKFSCRLIKRDCRCAMQDWFDYLALMVAEKATAHEGHPS